MRSAAVFLTDGNRDDLTFASVASLGLNQQESIDVHIVQAGFKGAIPESLTGFMQSRGHRVTATSIAPNQRKLKLRPHITATAYAKLEAIKVIPPDYETVFYFDNDMLFIRPLNLNSLKTPKLPMVAVPDFTVTAATENPHFLENCEKHGLAPRYFNSGLLGFDMDWFRSSAFVERFEEALISHQSFCEFRDGACHNMDQCAMNRAANREWHELPLAFNVQKAAFQTVLWQSAVIRHYTGSEKFLPARPHRMDSLEAAALTGVATACPDLGIAVPSRYFGLPYWLNGIRRWKARKSVTAGLRRRKGAIEFPIG